MKSDQDNNPWQFGWEAVGAIVGILAFIGFLIIEWDSLGSWGYIFILLPIMLFGLYFMIRFRSLVAQTVKVVVYAMVSILVVMAVLFLVIQVVYIADLTTRSYWLLGLGATALIGLTIAFFLEK